MALKLPDSAVPMGDFPVAKAVDIDFDDGENLQEKLDDGKLGGAGGGNVYANTPIGTVLSFAGLNPPNGYLLCDGGSYAVVDYQDLYDVIGNTYGGDGTNFNVPNLIDKFVQGSDTSGTEIEAGLPNINGTFGLVRDDYAGAPTGPFTITRSDIGIGGNGGTTGHVTFDASKSNAIYGNSDTVQPPALTMTYIIKAFHTNEGVDAPVELEDNVINHINKRINDIVLEQVIDEVASRLITGTKYPTTETCPIGCWYGMYIE